MVVHQDSRVVVILCERRQFVSACFQKRKVRKSEVCHCISYPWKVLQLTLKWNWKASSPVISRSQLAKIDLRKISVFSVYEVFKVNTIQHVEYFIVSRWRLRTLPLDTSVISNAMNFLRASFVEWLVSYPTS